METKLIKSCDLKLGDVFLFIGETCPCRYLGLHHYYDTCYLTYRIPGVTAARTILFDPSFEVELLDF